VHAIQTGLILTPGTIGILIASAGADRFARRHPQRWLLVFTLIGLVLGVLIPRRPAGTTEPEDASTASAA
jgi:F0F1-type ATP synthase assembly protein I